MEGDSNGCSGDVFQWESMWDSSEVVELVMVDFNGDDSGILMDRSRQGYKKDKIGI